MRKTFLLLIVISSAVCASLSAQNSAPAPGMGAFGQSAPPPGSTPLNSFQPAPPPGRPGAAPQVWGSPWYTGGFTNPLSNPIPPGNPNWQNAGNINVVAVGYDATGVWRTIPLNVNYQYNGVQYNVTVLNAWDPWTNSWNYGVDVGAINTSYFLRGTTYDFYVVLSTGTYYFNL